jgi:5-methylcytosine-specific restriction protein A
VKTIGQRLTRRPPMRLSVPPKEADPHYRTPEHKAWASTVIRRAGGMCQGPGCGRAGVRLFADHIHELRDGGDPLGPGQALCGACHSAKTMRERAKRLKSPA